MVALLENHLPSRNVRMNAPQVVVIREGMQMHENFHFITLVHKAQSILHKSKQISQSRRHTI